MKILHVYRTYFPDTQGGVQESIRQICAGTKEYGVENRVFTLSGVLGEKLVHLPEADIYRSNLTAEIASCGISFGGLLEFRKHLKWADIVHYHFPWPFADLLYLLWQDSTPTILTYHSDIVRQQGLLRLYRPLMNKFLRGVDRIVATSPNYLSSSKILKEYRDKITVIPLGLEESSYPAVTSNDMQRVDSQILGDFFLFVGVLRYYKGLDILLEAAKNAGYRIVIAGSGPEEGNLKRKAKDLNTGNVIFLGQVTDEMKVALLNRCVAVVFPSSMRSEAFGITLVEGLMMGKPLISCEIGSGTSYVNKHNETGLVIEPNDPEGLRNAMNVIYNDSKLRADFGKNARSRYERIFSGAKTSKHYVELYKEILG